MIETINSYSLITFMIPAGQEYDDGSEDYPYHSNTNYPTYMLPQQSYATINDLTAYDVPQDIENPDKYFNKRSPYKKLLKQPISVPDERKDEYVKQEPSMEKSKHEQTTAKPKKDAKSTAKPKEDIKSTARPREDTKSSTAATAVTEKSKEKVKEKLLKTQTEKPKL